MNPGDYKLLEEVGHGASATVYRAIYIPLNRVVAVKCLDLDRCNSNLDDIRKEAQTMSLIDHPNVIKAFCSFVVDHNLWVIMPFMAEGSCLHLMKIAHPDGFEESAIGSILKETLKALEYLHQHGHIHRDVKAGNILLDSNGEVKLGDFGVSACMFDKGDRQRSRNTFVGTPCWMAPEVLQPGRGYDFKADIWSLGITALELAHGHAPFSKYPPMKVLLMTIQNAPPGLDYDRDKKFSKSFKEMVAMCLVKDQTKRPTADKLLKHSFFKNAKPPELSVKKLFADLPPLWNRVKALQIKDAAQLALRKMPSAEQEALSQSEYQRGVSAWNFDVEDLKLQASLLQGEDEIKEIKEENGGIHAITKDSSTWKYASRKLASKDTICSEQINGSAAANTEWCIEGVKVLENGTTEAGNQGKLEFRENASQQEVLPPGSEKDSLASKPRTQTGKTSQSQSGPLMPGLVGGQSHATQKSDRSDIGNSQPASKAPQVRKVPSYSGPLMLPNRASANSLSAPIKSSGGFAESLDDKSRANLVQIKGRFSVTSENVDLVKDIPLCTMSRRSSQGSSPLRKSASVGEWISDTKLKPANQSSKDVGNNNLPASILMSHLQNLAQQASIQQDLILNLLHCLQLAEVPDASQNGKLPPLDHNAENNGSVEGATTERERLLVLQISELQARMNNLKSELTHEKLKYVQLQQQIEALSNHGSEEEKRLGDP